MTRRSWAKSRRILATVWFAGAGIVFAIVLVQTILGHYGADVEKAWGWFLPTIVPTLSLVIGAMAADALGAGRKIETVDSFFFGLSVAISAIYLFVVALTILAQPFAAMSATRLMELSNLWLGPLQGLVASALGVFFVRTE